MGFYILPSVCFSLDNVPNRENLTFQSVFCLSFLLIIGINSSVLASGCLSSAGMHREGVFLSSDSAARDVHMITIRPPGLIHAPNTYSQPSDHRRRCVPRHRPERTTTLRRLSVLCWIPHSDGSPQSDTFDFLAPCWLSRYQIKYILSSTTT